MKRTFIIILCLLLLTNLTHASSTETTGEDLPNTCIDGQLSVDYTNLDHGTIKVTILEPDEGNRYKLLVYHDRKRIHYTLDTKQENVIIPLQMGNGIYKLILVEKVEGFQTVYHGIGGAYFNLEIDDMDVWLQPNAKVDFSSPDKLLGELEDVVSPHDSARQKYEKIAQHMISAFSYDTQAALARYAPEYTDLGFLLWRRRATCEGLSAMMVALLRLEGIPSRLVIGKYENKAHAWVEAFVDNDIMMFDPSYPELGENPSNYFPERYY